MIVGKEEREYAIDAMQTNPTANLINDVDRYLQAGPDLEQTNVLLRKQLLLEAKKRCDLRAKIERQEQNEAVEAAELAHESIEDLEIAKQNMQESGSLLAQEEATLQEHNRTLAKALAQDPLIPRLEQTLEEIEQLQYARQTLTRIAAQQAAEYECSGLLLT